MSKARDLSKLLTDGLSSILANNSIGLPKLSNIPTDRLVGRDSAGTGAIEEISVSGGLEFTDATGLRTTAFTGDVTKAAAGTVLTIATGAVTTDKILNGNVTAAKVNTGEVAVLGTAQQYTRTHNFTATTLTASTSSVTWDLAVNQILILTLSANVSTWTIQNPQSGGVYILIVKQDTTGNRTLAFPTGNFKFPGGAAGAPTLTVTPSKSDILTFVYHGSHLHGVAVQDYAA